MDKNSFRSFICGVIITAIFLIGVPVSADTETTLSDRIVAAITGNNVNSRLDTMNTKLTNLTTAVNNSGGSAGSGNIKAKCVKAGSGTTLSYTGGPGFCIMYPCQGYSDSGIGSGFTANVTIDGQTINRSIFSYRCAGIGINNGGYGYAYGEAQTFYFQNSISIDATYTAAAIYVYI